MSVFDPSSDEPLIVPDAPAIAGPDCSVTA
jgi:hypothetical protein